MRCSVIVERYGPVFSFKYKSENIVDYARTLIEYLLCCNQQPNKHKNQLAAARRRYHFIRLFLLSDHKYTERIVVARHTHTLVLTPFF